MNLRSSAVAGSSCRRQRANSWGNMLNNAQSYFGTAPWVAIFSGFMITLSVTSFNFIGDGLRDALDPQLGRP